MLGSTISLFSRSCFFLLSSHHFFEVKHYRLREKLWIYYSELQIMRVNFFLNNLSIPSTERLNNRIHKKNILNLFTVVYLIIFIHLLTKVRTTLEYLRTFFITIDNVLFCILWKFWSTSLNYFIHLKPSIKLTIVFISSVLFWRHCPLTKWQLHSPKMNTKKFCNDLVLQYFLHSVDHR